MALRVSYSQQAALRLSISERMLRASYSQRHLLRVIDSVPPAESMILSAPPTDATSKYTVLCYEKCQYLFYRYLRVSSGTMQKCMLHNSVRYQNTRSRDPITLLSMDIMVATFLEIGVSDLLVLTRLLQDPLYMEV